jgi:hypothetical protein
MRCARGEKAEYRRTVNSAAIASQGGALCAGARPHSQTAGTPYRNSVESGHERTFLRERLRHQHAIKRIAADRRECVEPGHMRGQPLRDGQPPDESVRIEQVHGALTPTVQEGFDFFVRHWPPPVVAGQRPPVDGRVVPPGAQRKRPLARGDEFRHRDAVAGDEDSFAFKDSVEEFREIRLGFMDVERGHDLTLIQKQGSRNDGSGFCRLIVLMLM